MNFIFKKFRDDRDATPYILLYQQVGSEEYTKEPDLNNKYIKTKAFNLIIISSPILKRVLEEENKDYIYEVTSLNK